MQNSVKRYKHITFAGSYTEEMQEKALDHGLFHLSISTKKLKFYNRIEKKNNVNKCSRNVNVFKLVFRFSIATIRWGVTIKSKRNNPNTLHSPAVMSENIQNKHE